MKLSKGVRSILGTLVDQADRTVAEVIRDRGGTASNVRATGHWARRRLGEVALAADRKDIIAVRAIKIVKGARRLGERY